MAEKHEYFNETACKVLKCCMSIECSVEFV